MAMNLLFVPVKQDVVSRFYFLCESSSEISNESAWSKSDLTCLIY